MNIQFKDYAVTFNNDNGGFPTKIIQYLRNGIREEVVRTDAPWLTVRLADGRTAVPRVSDTSLPQFLRDEDGTARIQYNNIAFYAGAERLHNWRLNLDYEIIPDGNCFIGMSFEAFDYDKPSLSGFTLRIPMNFGTDKEVTYSYLPRPRTPDSTGLANAGKIGCDFTDRETREFDSILPLAGFCFGHSCRLSRRMEWFVEDQMALDSNPDHVSSRILWEENSPVLEYEFETATLSNRPYPYYWRNKIGFTLTQTPKILKKAPLRTFFYSDSKHFLPDTEDIRTMAENGADLLILDECWRRNAVNGGFPADRSRFENLIAECHRNGIRVAPYVRGNEISVRENACGWFDYYLQKDFDGLYADYASPFGFHEVNMEYSGGHFRFKRYYRHFQKLREQTVGADGILSVHSALPYYGHMLAGLADGMMPDSDLLPTVRFGSEDAKRDFRPLWKLLGLLKDEKQLCFDSDLCDDTILCDSETTHLSVFGLQDGSKLSILSNDSSEKRVCRTNLRLSCVENRRCLLLKATADGLEAVSVSKNSPVEAELDGGALCGFLVCEDNEKWGGRLNALAENSLA